MAQSKRNEALDAPEAATVPALLAVHKIVYGAGQVAEPDSFFVPASDAEREELLAAGAAVEPEGADLALAQAVAESTEPPAGGAPDGTDGILG